MAASIKFDSTEILSTTYTPQFVKHETAPDRILGTLQLAREDGEVLISDKRGTKKIQLKGILTGSSQADLESKISSFKELFSRAEKNLDIDWNSGTLRYVATCINHEFNRDHYNLLFVPWSAEFIVLSGEGKNSAGIETLSNNAKSVASPVTDSFTFLGSKAPKPKITLHGHSWPSSGMSARGVEYKNTDTGEKIQITHNGALGADIVIDCLLKKVTYNALEQIFYGVFPKFKVGLNNILLTVGGITNQSSRETAADPSADGGGTTHVIDTSDKTAQGFMIPYADDTFSGVRLSIYKNGAPGNMTVRIETDNNGVPSGTLADAAATLTITAGSVPSATWGYITQYFASPFRLEANTKYWVVITAAGVGGANSYDLATVPDSIAYSKGEALYYNHVTPGWDSITIYGAGGSTIMFQVLYGGQPGSGTVDDKVEYTKTYL